MSVSKEFFCVKDTGSKSSISQVTFYDSQTSPKVTIRWSSQTFGSSAKNKKSRREWDYPPLSPDSKMPSSRTGEFSNPLLFASVRIWERKGWRWRKKSIIQFAPTKLLRRRSLGKSPSLLRDVLIALQIKKLRGKRHFSRKKKSRASRGLSSPHIENGEIISAANGPRKPWSKGVKMMDDLEKTCAGEKKA